MSAATDLFVEEARAVTVAEAVDRLGISGLKDAGTTERVGPCPACGGTDRFQVARGKNAWLCRGAAEGRDALSLAAHVLGLDLGRRQDLFAACSELTGRAVPDGRAETPQEEEARKARLDELRQTSQDKARRDAIEQAGYRERERAKARGKWEAGAPGVTARAYLAARLGVRPHDIAPPPFLRDRAGEPYWHGKDKLGRAVSIYEGPAMVGPFVNRDGLVIGCHLTWIDLRRAPKLRPDLGRDPDGEPLKTKKMRGTKSGGLIPLYGFVEEGGRIVPSRFATRLVSGEGIENTVAIALAEEFRPDTLYAAAGDLGNLAGPVDAASNFRHPTLTKTGKGGRVLPVRVPGPMPKADQGADDAMPVPEAVTDIRLVADGDSEPVFTAAAMARAQVRLARPDRVIDTIWPKAGADFAGMFQGA